MRKALAVILGIRPDVIRASLILKKIRMNRRFDTQLIWSGQHYSENLKDIFFKELRVRRPDIELGAFGKSDADLVSSIIRRLYPVLRRLRPRAAVFLGDTNTVMGCLAAAQLNIPIVHIEACMRSYDWRMPEEKYRTVIDHLSDVMYAYLDEYKQQGIAEGLNPDSIIVTGNPIVDVLETYYFQQKNRYEKMATREFFSRRHIKKGEYYLMTCHRRENVEDKSSLKNILELARSTSRPIYFPASYRTQTALRRFGLTLAPDIRMVNPVGYTEFLLLMTNARGVLTDSGTVAEEACVLHVPAVQMRMSTERPQLYDVGACVKFDPTDSRAFPVATVMKKLESLRGKRWANILGDGQSSERIAKDLLSRLQSDKLASHSPSEYHLDIRHAFMNDVIEQILWRHQK